MQKRFVAIWAALAVAVAVAVAFVVPGSVFAQEPAPPELTATDLESFLDGLMPAEIERADIAGAVVAVVKDGQPLFMKGYGYSDTEKKIPVSAQTTLFRPGSISKLFTWTAVMQQVEQGKLELDRDVNEYLDFSIPPAFGKPITLRDLMTHRPGFEETIKDLFVASASDLFPLSEYLRTHIPARIFPPGTIPAYSNYGCALAGYIVQRVSGQAFDDYVEEHIFQPLEMSYATFRQPLPDSLAPFMSKGYVLASAGAKPFEYVEVAPAGSLSASAESMTHFMIAHLQDGRYQGARILEPATAVEMHSRQEGWPEPMNAMALGFYEESRNGHRIIGHAGDTVQFHSDLHLILDSNVGLFVSYNSAGRAEVSPRSVLFDEFMDRYFPASPPQEPTFATAAEDAGTIAGLYKVSRRFETNILAVSTLLSELRVKVDPRDDTIYAKGISKPNGQPRHFREIAPMLFRAVDGPEKLYLQTDAAGRSLLYINDYPYMVFQPVQNLLENRTMGYALLGFSVGVIVLTILAWPVAAVMRRHYGKPLGLSSGAKRLRRLVRMTCVVDVAFVAGVAVAFSRFEIAGGIGPNGDLWLHLLQSLGVLGIAGAVVAVWNGLRSWGDRGQWFWSKIWYTLVALACVGFSWFLFYWHMLNFHLHY